MTIRSKFATLAMLGLLGLSAGSCSDFLDPTPQTSVDRNDVFTDLEGARGAVIGIYGALTSSNYYGLEYPIFADLVADNLAHIGTFPTFAQIKNRNILTDNANNQNTYFALYRTIGRANNVIAQVPGITSIEETQRNAFVAEALFLRALAHFDATRYWGDVAIVLTPTSTPDATLNVARSPQAAVYEQVLTDLAAAEPSLPEVNVGRATKSAARALRARVELYRKNWQAAAAAADQIIASNRFQLLPSYRTIFTTENSIESIFEVQFDANTSSQYAFYFLPGSSGGRNELSPTGAASSLPTAYEAGDLRKDATISNGAATVTTSNGLRIPAGYGIKFIDPGTGTDNFRVFRFAEILLIGAEAKAQLGDIPGSLTLLNRVRVRAGLAARAGLTQAALLDAIAQERRVELALEGHRWFDLVRTGRAQSVLGIVDPNRLLFPIPFRETVNNPNITQNPGY
ncbi:RagB/SusD domain protein [Hymenobacter roseosalivarius DSM 11622]|uniref:RagB/SusD domain protein n=1 Tax=Hymenobacter roseosalivarius DSM 11622 TaxID=645990 RepID=A0A1W1VVD9_9BACT|nr:RagB/SusD family nutrient uptake outer membrane protein [Hymenobacter roseosalivarius]SMB97296.1 RagB/SusD domain protein [Hymenobacter roseosalivarius DSM 11622]